MTSEFWTPQVMIALIGFGGVVIGGLITWGVQTQLAKRKFAFDKDLAERQFAHNKELADKKFTSDKDLADRNFAQEKAQLIHRGGSNSPSRS
jgi:Calicivirus putative RNA polymerase/capsid protein